MRLQATLVIAITLFLCSCTERLENYTVVEKAAKDTSFTTTTIETPQTKNILVEEFTGVRCQNCPTGHEEINNMLNTFKDRLIPISLHSTFLGNKFSFSNFDLLNDESEKLYKEYGASSKPAAMIDRTPFSNVLVLSRTYWSPAADIQKNKTTPVNIHVTSTYNSTKATYRISATIHFTSAYTNDLKYTIYLVENNIVTAQLLPDASIDTLYTHKHVLRKTLTDFNGNTLAKPYDKGKTFIKEFDYAPLKEYKPENMQVIVSVHQSGVNKEVLHAEEIPLK